MSVKSHCSRERVREQILPRLRPRFQNGLEELLNHKPPLIEKGHAGQTFLLTEEGARVALALVLPSQSASDLSDDYPRFPAPQRIHRGANNRAMGEYANELGGEFVIKDGRRCNFCSETNSHFVKKGGKYLCQVCYAMGRRFERA